MNAIIRISEQKIFCNNNLKIFNASAEDKESLQIMYDIAKTNNIIKMSAGEERSIVISNPKEQYIIKLKLTVTNARAGGLKISINQEFIVKKIEHLTTIFQVQQSKNLRSMIIAFR